MHDDDHFDRTAGNDMRPYAGKDKYKLTIGGGGPCSRNRFGAMTTEAHTKSDEIIESENSGLAQNYGGR